MLLTATIFRDNTYN